ncbi:MAG: TonB-dependent receptor [Acidobacteria bacterium]|nr:TonB-dependent receptor [Acidobacteriota bacterium]
MKGFYQVRNRLAYATVLFAALGIIAPEMAAQSLSGEHESMLTGIVRDATGAPQMGALVQVLAHDARPIAAGLTDLRGHYRIPNIRPGSYTIRATAALFLPAERAHMNIRPGSRSIVDLTLTTLANLSGWLPAQRRSAGEPGDDWMWTLRSSANRPILRAVSDDGKGQIAISSSGREGRRGSSGLTQARLAVTSDDSGFGHGGMHQTLLLDRIQTDGSTQMLRADLSGSRTPYPVAPSVDVTTGFESRICFNGYARTLLTYHSHPELVGRHGTMGLQAATIRSAQRMQLGDTLMIDAGSMLREINMAGNSVSMLPFVRVSVRPASHVVLTYGYATSEELQSLDDLDRVQGELPVAFSVDGKLRSQSASHQELALAGNAGHTVMEIALYRDNIDGARIAGTGVLTPEEIAAGGIVADPTTQSFRALSNAFRSEGYRVGMKQQLTPALTLSARYEVGSALSADTGSHADVHTVLASLKSHRVQAATVSLHGRVLKTGTRIRTSYRWQPEGTLTAVDAFDAYGDPAYFSVHLRQPLRIARILPNGFEAVVDVTNLLAQGYQPFVSSDGRTLYFAQAPKVLQAGLSFTF